MVTFTAIGPASHQCPLTADNDALHLVNDCTSDSSVAESASPRLDHGSSKGDVRHRQPVGVVMLVLHLDRVVGDCGRGGSGKTSDKCLGSAVQSVTVAEEQYSRLTKG